MSTIAKKRRGAGWLLPLVLIVGCVGLFSIRFIGIQPFRAPSGSMQPAVMPGDYFLVAKWSYGYSRYSFAPFQDAFPRGRVLGGSPERGDIVVFRPVPEPDRDFIKRIVGVPGDRIQMIDGVLTINGAAVKMERLGLQRLPDSAEVEGWRETLPSGVSYVVLNRMDDGEWDNTRVYEVPAGHYFVMGDDRDNSQDSRTRFIDMVPYDNLVGKALK